jgi:hypothetical protein
MSAPMSWIAEGSGTIAPGGPVQRARITAPDRERQCPDNTPVDQLRSRSAMRD